MTVCGSKIAVTSDDIVMMSMPNVFVLCFMYHIGVTVT